MRGKSFSLPTTPIATTEREGFKPYRAAGLPESPQHQDMDLTVAANPEIIPLQEVQLRPPLLDPAINGLSDGARYYLFHFSDRLCQDLVTYDTPSHNPYRNLIALSRDHPFLLQAIIANSAIHISNLHSRTPPSRKPDTAIGTTSLANDLSTRFQAEALKAEHRALRLLREALANIDCVGRDIVLTTILLFINFELMSSGKDRWKFHVQGARNMIENFGLLNEDSSIGTTMLHDYVIADCLIYYVLGSAFSSTKSNSRREEHHFKLLEMLERGEMNSYLSCPAELLQVILWASHLARTSSMAEGEEPEPFCSQGFQRRLELLNKVQSFDVEAWAAGVQGIALHNDFESRLHVASAHRSAISLYINRVVSAGDILENSDVKRLVADIIYHLSFIRPGNQLLKSTSWPAFIAGIETKEPREQDWVIEHLSALWEMLPWGYIHTAVEMLATIWRSNEGQDSDSAVAKDWLLNLIQRDWIVV